MTTDAEKKAEVRTRLTRLLNGQPAAKVEHDSLNEIRAQLGQPSFEEEARLNELTKCRVVTIRSSDSLVDKVRAFLKVL